MTFQWLKFHFTGFYKNLRIKKYWSAIYRDCHGLHNELYCVKSTVIKKNARPLEVEWKWRVLNELHDSHISNYQHWFTLFTKYEL